MIWPAQKAILSGKVPADKLAEVRKRALFFSRMNAYLSGPMLFGMLAPSHYGAINIPTALIAAGLGAAAIAWAIVGFFNLSRAVFWSLRQALGDGRAAERAGHFRRVLAHMDEAWPGQAGRGRS